MFAQYLKVAPSKTSGEGVFSTVEISANEAIAEATGKIYTAQELPDPNDTNVLQTGPNDYMNISGTLRYINHSCDPNCRFVIVGTRAILYSLYVIPAGSELTFDYSTTSTDTHNTWKMNCSCGSYKCRKVISGHQYLSTEQTEEYRKKGMLPLFITFPVFHKR